MERNFNVRIGDYPFWLITTHSMQYSWGGNVSIQLIKEVADNIAGHSKVIMNHGAAEKLGIADGDLVEVRSPLDHTKGSVMLCEGIRCNAIHDRPIGSMGDAVRQRFYAPSMNALVPMLLDLTDATGSGADLVKVKVTRLRGAK